VRGKRSAILDFPGGFKKLNKSGKTKDRKGRLFFRTDLGGGPPTRDLAPHCKSKRLLQGENMDTVVPGQNFKRHLGTGEKGPSTRGSNFKLQGAQCGKHVGEFQTNLGSGNVYDPPCPILH